MSTNRQASQGGIGRSLQRFFMQGHVSLYRRSGGKLGGKSGGKSFIILTTTGRKTGVQRDTPLFFFKDGDRFIVIASNGGAPKHPTWWLNLQSNPQAKVQLGSRIIPVTAQRAEGEEKDRLWAIIAEKYQNFVRYQQRAEREIPVVILTPQV